MLKPSILVASCAVLLLALSGCDSMSRGIVFTGNGKVGANNARNQRENAQDAVRVAIEDDLGQGASVSVEIEELPIWIESDIGGDGAWKWPRLTARVVVNPPAGKTLPPAKLAEYTTDVGGYLLAKVVKKDPQQFNLSLSEGAVAPSSLPPASAPAAAGPRSYVVQEGDTLALISTAFYGSPQHWRRILEANPGVAAEAVKPGVRLLVP
jgi:nucleoid-associated protein YgaU